MIRHACIVCCTLLLAGCMSDDGEKIGRPADQGFGGEERPDESVVMTHRFTAVGLKGAYDRVVTVTVEGRPDSDPAQRSYETVLPADGVAFARDPGLGGPTAGGDLTVVVVDSAGNTSGETVAVEFNP